MANTYWGGMRMSGNGGGGSINTSQLTQDILDGVEEIIRPSGHQYPNVNLYPSYMCPMINVRYHTNGYCTHEDMNKNVVGYFNAIETNDGWSQDTIYTIEHLDVSRFQCLYNLFDSGFNENTANMELDLSGWDVSNVKSFRKLFGIYNRDGILKKLNLSNWDTRNAQDMYNMFSSSSSYVFKILELDISGWNVTNLSNMDGVFYSLKTPVIDLSSWDLSYVSSFNGTFGGNINSVGQYEIVSILWGGSCNAPLDLSITKLTPENAELFFQSLDPKMTNNTVTITMPTTAQGADLSIAEAKGYTITNITQP